MIDSGIADVSGRLKHLLAESPLAELRRVHVDVEDNRILLSGKVRSFYAKQMAQETVRELASSRELSLVNSLDVSDYPSDELSS